MDFELVKAGLRLLALLPGFVLHELGHAMASTALGDPTPKNKGRLTLNPVKHLDPVGAFAMFAMVILGFPFAWAKPVEINPNHYDDYRKGMAAVALAGPFMNLLLMLMGGAAYGILDTLNLTSQLVDQGFGIFLVWNGILMIFNLIPVPPLDGGKVLAVLLPGDLMTEYLTIGRNYGFAIILGLIGLEFLAGVPVFSTVITGGLSGVRAVLDAILPTPLPPTAF